MEISKQKCHPKGKFHCIYIEFKVIASTPRQKTSVEFIGHSIFSLLLLYTWSIVAPFRLNRISKKVVDVFLGRENNCSIYNLTNMYIYLFYSDHNLLPNSVEHCASVCPFIFLSSSLKPLLIISEHVVLVIL